MMLIELKSIESNTRCLCRVFQAEEENCNIFHDKIKNVHIDGVLNPWKANDAELNCLQLPCGHKFNSCAILIHFLNQDMRCPVCRSGPCEKMNIVSIPKQHHFKFIEKVSTMNVESPVPSTPTNGVQWDVHVPQIQRDLVLFFQAKFVLGDNIYMDICKTNLRTTQNINNVENWHEYHTQRSFSRIMNTFIRSHKNRKDVQIRFVLQHPLFLEEINTTPFYISNLNSSTFFVFTADIFSESCSIGKITSRDDCETMHTFAYNFCTDSIVEACIDGLYTTSMYS